jgi:hypothetical protein
MIGVPGSTRASSALGMVKSASLNSVPPCPASGEATTYVKVSGALRCQQTLRGSCAVSLIRLTHSSLLPSSASRHEAQVLR